MGAKCEFNWEKICNNCKGKEEYFRPICCRKITGFDTILLIFMPYTNWLFDFVLFKALFYANNIFSGFMTSFTECFLFGPIMCVVFSTTTRSF